MSDKKVAIDYTSRDFNSIKTDLVNYAKRYYPNSFKDFNQASFGALMLDSVAYVGDILSFYLDYQANESFLSTALEFDNVVRLGRSLGYKYSPNPSSYGKLTFYVLVPANTNGIGVDSDYLPVLSRGSRFIGGNGNLYTLTENVDFSDETNDIIAAKFSEDSSLTTYYAVKAKGNAVSGEFETALISVNEHVPFLKLEIPVVNIIEVLSVIDSDANQWYEVDELSQDVVYIPIQNSGQDRQAVPKILKPYAVPRRYAVTKEYGRTYLQFGHGSESQLSPETEAVQDPSKVILKTHAKNYIKDMSFDPSNLLSTDKFGVSPANTTFTIKYRINRAENVNAATNTITTVENADFEFPSVMEGAVLSSSDLNDVVTSLEVDNDEPFLGDVITPTVKEVKQRINSAHSAQNRAVTLEDYKQLVYRMPPEFGAIKKCHVVRDVDSFKRNLNLYILSEASDGKLIKANDSLKRNLKTWINRHKMINDTMDILDAEIVNIGIEFNLVSKVASNKYEVLETATNALRSKYSNYSFDIGEPLHITDIYQILNRVPGVADTSAVEILQKSNSGYSQIAYDIEFFTSPDGRYVSIPQNAAFELKFASIDIKGTVV
tara:strand:+ start:10359 stop:12170 length:1812 start_codon:yes stop_codon:yes gene_type:complete